MSTLVKVVVYIGLITCTVMFGLSAYWAYNLREETQRQRQNQKQNVNADQSPEADAATQPKAGGAQKKVVITQQLPLGTYFAAFLVSVVVLGLFTARDVSGFVAQTTVDFVFNDEGQGVQNPEYEEADEVWKSGDYLEAIRMLREYYRKYPREVHAKLRVAEIYESNLANPLAAALEYEEVLKLRLPAERWGWAAIHLCNLYNKLNQPDKANALLNRINDEYGKTAAARKAREKLGIPEPLPEEQSFAATQSPQPDEAPSNLPPGFSPKKH
jgi:hypothetical protein